MLGTVYDVGKGICKYLSESSLNTRVLVEFSFQVIFDTNLDQGGSGNIPFKEKFPLKEREYNPEPHYQ
jgi:hypothetical protein